MIFDQPEKRRANGVVYTPQAIASEVVRFLRDELAIKGRILEPSVGDGAFVAALIDNGLDVEDLVAVDIDDGAIAKLTLAYPSATFVTDDFLAFYERSQNEKFALIVGNPPYIRLRTFSAEFRYRVERLSAMSGYPRPALKNAWAAFSVAAEQCLTQDGTLAFVVPYELMHVGYGITLQHELFSKFSRVDIFIPDAKAFKSIDQDAVLFVARKRSKRDEGVFVSRVESLEKLSLSSALKIDYADTENLSENLKAFLLPSETLKVIKARKARALKVSDYCRSMAGIVTAANDYFILRHEEIIERDLSAWAKPILKKSAYLAPGPVIGTEAFDTIKALHPAYLLDFNGIGPDKIPETVQTYLNIGEKNGAADTYKSRHRKNWYQVPIVPPSPAFFFKRSHSMPRLCVNEAGIYVTDAAYQIEPKEGYSAKGICFSFYNSVSLLFAEIEGRFYGGGVLELTPNEFKKVPLIFTDPSDEEFATFVQLMTAGDVDALTDFGDGILMQKHQFEASELAKFRTAGTILREHRLRHGRST